MVPIPLDVNRPENPDLSSISGVGGDFPDFSVAYLVGNDARVWLGGRVTTNYLVVVLIGPP